MTSRSCAAELWVKLAVHAPGDAQWTEVVPVERLEPLAGTDFHPYRRALATERTSLPRADVAAAGGWRDVRALELCYQQTDEATMLAVVTEPRKLREAKQ